jgi:hypothetical protein
MKPTAWSIAAPSSAAATGCTPQPVSAPATVSFGASISLVDMGQTCATTVQLTGDVQKVCGFQTPSFGQCAEMLECTSGRDNTGPAADPANGDLGFAFAKTLSSGSISGDLQCAGAGRSAATPADATRDQGTAQTNSEVIANCVIDLALLSSKVPALSSFPNGRGIDRLFNGSGSNAPKCLDGVRSLTALEWASDADRVRALGGATRAADPRGTRLSLRLLQQWMQVHALLATEAGQRMAVPDAVRGTVPADGVPNPIDALASSIAGWDLLPTRAIVVIEKPPCASASRRIAEMQRFNASSPTVCPRQHASIKSWRETTCPR